MMAARLGNVLLWASLLIAGGLLWLIYPSTEFQDYVMPGILVLSGIAHITSLLAAKIKMECVIEVEGNGNAAEQ